jgi:hypothetical protein
MNLAIEKSMIVLARLRLKALKVSLAGRQADLNQAQNIYHQLTGLTSLRFVQNNDLSVETIKELVILDNLAVLSIKTVHPEILGKLSKEAGELSRYLDLPARTLLDLLFKKGERFHNEAAISVAYHRGLISDIQHEADAYARLNAREQKRDA